MQARLPQLVGKGRSGDCDQAGRTPGSPRRVITTSLECKGWDSSPNGPHHLQGELSRSPTFAVAEPSQGVRNRARLHRWSCLAWNGTRGVFVQLCGIINSGDRLRPRSLFCVVDLRRMGSSVLRYEGHRSWNTPVRPPFPFSQPASADLLASQDNNQFVDGPRG